MEKGRFRMYDRKCDVDIRLLGCALVLLVMALLTIHTGLAKKDVTAAADPAPAAVVSTQDTRLSEDAGSVRYGCVHKVFLQNYEIATRFHKKNGISKLATFS